MLASRKPRHYFYCHTVTIPSAYTPETILRNRENTWRVAQWNVELGEFDVRFEPRTAINAQPLTDFIPEWTDPGQGHDDNNLAGGTWTLSLYGSLTINNAGAG